MIGAGITGGVRAGITGVVTEGTKKERKIIPISGVEELLAFEPKEYSPKEELLVFEPNVGQCHN